MHPYQWENVDALAIPTRIFIRATQANSQSQPFTARILPPRPIMLEDPIYKWSCKYLYYDNITTFVTGSIFTVCVTSLTKLNIQMPTSLPGLRFGNSKFTRKICQLENEVPRLGTPILDFCLKLTTTKTSAWQCTCKSKLFFNRPFKHSRVAYQACIWHCFPRVRVRVSLHRGGGCAV